MATKKKTTTKASAQKKNSAKQKALVTETTNKKSLTTKKNIKTATTKKRSSKNTTASPSKKKITAKKKAVTRSESQKKKTAPLQKAIMQKSHQAAVASSPSVEAKSVASEGPMAINMSLDIVNAGTAAASVTSVEAQSIMDVAIANEKEITANQEVQEDTQVHALSRLIDVYIAAIISSLVVVFGLLIGMIVMNMMSVLS